MPELERDLRTLGSVIELPPERDLVPGVRARLAAAPPRRLRRWHAAVVLLAALLIALGIAFAVPPARSAILRFLGLESVTVIQVEKLPPASSTPAVFGRRISLATARRDAGFRPLLPDIGPPSAVYLDDAGEYLILLFGSPATRVRLAESRVAQGLITKFAHSEGVEEVSVDGRRGLWLKGPHVVIELYGQPRLTGNALLWERNGLLLRLEGKLTRKQALDVARSMR